MRYNISNHLFTVLTLQMMPVNAPAMAFYEFMPHSDERTKLVHEDRELLYFA